MTPAPYGQNLPIFPTFHDKPSEDRLERAVERLMDHADSALIRGDATGAQYDAWVRALDAWAQRQR